MERPSDFDEVKEYGDFKNLEPGGHILKILKVEETVSSTNKPMIVIYFDTADRDTQPGFYKARFNNDTRKNKKWNGCCWQLIYDSDGKTTNRGFKTFITAVEKSNSSSFKVKWGDKFCECFKDKLVGGVFRREQYVNDKDKIAWSVKCIGFRSVAAIDEGIDIPEDKYLPDDVIDKLTDTAPVSSSSFSKAVESADEDYPF